MPVVQRFKRTITWVLLIFIVSAIVMMFRPRETVSIPDGLCILFWHAEKRCANCLKMEEFLMQAFSDHEDFRLFVFEYDVLSNQSLAWEFNVGTTTIILVERKDQQNARVRDLTTKVWENINDEAAFVNMLRQELEQFGNTGESEESKKLPASGT